MTTATINKRHQARNERALQELIKTVPGNDRCADCQARNPGWASWSLGIFLCMRCASLHRKLGTHISKVKSLSMDSWSNDQVDNMKRVGNVVSNRTFTPNNSKPNLPLDMDEVDSAMERFIRQKYEHRSFQGGHIGRNVRHNTGSTSTSSEEPPPLPPKPGRRFGFGSRAASSAYPLSSARSFEDGDTSSSREAVRQPVRTSSPPRTERQSVLSEASVRPDSFEAKLVTLSEMGFPDSKRNATVLGGLGGSLERSIETLIRLGEGSSKAQSQQRAASSGNRNATPASQHQRNNVPPFETKQPQSATVSSEAASISQSLFQTNPFNPFSTTSASQQSRAGQPLDEAFQNLQVSQPLFPNATGGFPQQPPHETSYYQTFTPPISSQSQHNYFSSPQPPTHPYFQNQLPQQQPLSNLNPFISQQSAFSNILTSPWQNQSASEATQQQVSFNPQMSPQYTEIPQFPQNYQPTHQMQPQMLAPQPTGRADKSSIMDLYNHPHLAPAPGPLMQNLGSISPNSSGNINTAPPLPSLPENIPGPTQRSFSMPVGASPAGSRNPFLAKGTAPEQEAGASGRTAAPAAPTSAHRGGMSRHVSQESVDVGGWQQSGRHSPDAFASLSSRFMR